MRIKKFKLEEYFALYEFTTDYLLCSSDCEAYTIKELFNLEPSLLKNFDKLSLGYTESLGDQELRKQITGLYKSVDPDNIIVFAGAEEGIFIYMNVVLNKGDHVIVQFPAYQSLFEIANSIGCEVTKWIMEEENNWDPSLDFLRSNIKKNTKAIIINFPHNPTGCLVSKDYFEKISEICKENQIAIFSDEVYRYLEFNPKDRLPGMCDINDDAISLGVMSKSFGLAGLRIGWIATKDKELYSKLASFKNYTTICNSAPSEFLATLALRNKDRIIERNLNIIQKNLNLLDIFFEKYSKLFSWVKPKAGSIAFPRMKGDINIEEFCLDLVNKKSVLLMPGTNYDFDNKHFRIGFGRKNMPVALNKLEEYLNEYII